MATSQPAFLYWALTLSSSFKPSLTAVLKACLVSAPAAKHLLLTETQPMYRLSMISGRKRRPRINSVLPPPTSMTSRRSWLPSKAWETPR